MKKKTLIAEMHVNLLNVHVWMNIYMIGVHAFALLCLYGTLVAGSFQEQPMT